MLLVFLVIHVSEGSVATYVRCGEMTTWCSIANFQPSLLMKEFLKLVKICYCPKFGGFLCLEQCTCSELSNVMKLVASHTHT